MSAHKPGHDGFPRDQDLARLGVALAAEVEPAPAHKILIVVPDRTRSFPIEEVLPALLGALLARGARAGHIQVAIASGSHVASDADGVRLGPLPGAVRVLRHDAGGRAVVVGTTARGTEVGVHPALLEADHVFVLGGIALHYFAGFGGGGKMLFPGLGERRSIAANHRLALAPERGLARGVEPARTRDNPVWLDLRDAHRMLPVARHLTLWRRQGRWHGGRWSNYPIFDAMCEAYAAATRAGERHGADVVVASCGGWPRDIDVVQSHKALFHAALYAKDGGEILFDSNCPEGIGSRSLARWLALPDRAALETRARAAYDLNAQTAISLAAIAERVRVTWVSSNPPRVLERWGFRLVTPDGMDAHVARVRAAERAGAKVVRLPVAADCIPASPATL